MPTSSAVNSGASQTVLATGARGEAQRPSSVAKIQRVGSVELTIDPAAQQAAWDLLGDQRGAVVALDPETGAILAMVSKPSYDPNVLAGHSSSAVNDAWQELLNDPDDPLINRTISGDLYPPGSTFKPPLRTILLSAVANPNTCSLVTFGGIDSAFGSVTTSTNDGPGCASASLNASLSSVGSSTRRAWKPIALAIAA